MQTQKPTAPTVQSSVATAKKFDIDKAPPTNQDLRQFLQLPQIQEQVRGILPKHLTPERITGLMLSATLRTPKLMRYNMRSILMAMIQISELGLEVAPSFGHLYLIPYENKKLGIFEAKVEIGYGGLIELVYRSGKVNSVDAIPVFHGEPFQMIRGSNPHVMHESLMDIEQTEKNFRGVYCIAKLKTGGEVFELMPRSTVDSIRTRSKSPNDGPWVTDYVEMARKSVLRRAQKRLPKSSEDKSLAAGLELEGEYDGDTVDHAPAPALPPASRTILTQVPANFGVPPEEPPPPQADPPGMNPETGEVPAEATEASAADPDDNTLLGRIRRETKEEIAALQAEAGALAKEDPSRAEVGKAMGARRKELGV